MSASPPREKASRRGRAPARTAGALLASAATNGLALAALAAAGAFPLRATGPPVPIELARLDGVRWEANRRVAGAPAAPLPAVAATSQPSSTPKPPDGRVVRVAPSPDSRRPTRARFLAERDNTVERETQWRGPRPPDAPLAARPSVGAGAQGIPLPGEEGNGAEAAPGREGGPVRDGREQRIALARLALRDGAAAAARLDEPTARDGAGEGGARRTGRFDPRVLPVGAGFTGAGGGAPSGDRLPGVEGGDATLVNTRAFRYAAFYQRVHEAIAGEWDPNGAWDARDPHDRVLGRSTRKVLVDIVLDPEGELREARLVRGSGVDFFDRECLRAIAAAAPFPNPPRGLVGPDGLVVLQGWGLVFEWGHDALIDRLLPRR